MKIDTNIKLVEDLPSRVKAFTHVDLENNYYICINGNLCDTARTTAFLHEMQHVERGDMFADKLAGELEKAQSSR